MRLFSCPIAADVRKGNSMIARTVLAGVAAALMSTAAHAEILAIRAACAALGSERLTGCDLWVTLEPCPTCAGAIAAARFDRLYYGASDPKSGGVAQGPRVFEHAQAHHAPEVYSGFEEEACAELLRAFFAARRD